MGTQVEGGEQDLTVWLRLGLNAMVFLPQSLCVRITGICHLPLTLEDHCLK